MIVAVHLPSNASVGLSIDQVSDFDQFFHADFRPKRYYLQSYSETISPGDASEFHLFLRLVPKLRGHGTSTVST